MSGLSEVRSLWPGVGEPVREWCVGGRRLPGGGRQVNRPVFAERAMVWPGAGAGRRAGEGPGDVLVHNQSSMMARVVSRMRRANGELVPLKTAAARRRK